MSENILTFLTLLVFMECSCFLPTDGRVYEAPSKVVYRSIGSDVVFTWCVSSTWLNRSPTVTFYLKNPVSRSVDERAIAKVSPTQVVEVLPNFSVHKSLFSRSQINVYVTNCTANRTGVQLTNYSLAISNLSMSQSRFYEIYVNYLFDIFGTENGARLNVVEPPSFVVKESRKMEKLEEGKSFSEVCRVISELPMNVTWFKGSQIKAAGVNSSTLAIDSLKRSDNGTYTCLATNELATIKRFADLFVAYPVTIKRLLYSTRKSFIGESATFRCFSNGYPKPVYEWKTPNPYGRHNSSHEDDSSILNVEFVSSADFGNYTCSVKNSISNSSQTVPVTQLFRPNKISSITYDRRPFGVVLLWNKTDWDGGSNVTGYILSVSDENSDPVEHKKIPETRFDVENLKKNTNYTICVQAENIVGKSNKTCVHIKTLNEGKPERPAILKVTLHPGMVMVTWKIPSPDVLYYVVMYKKEGLEKWSEKNISGLIGSVKCDLENLKPGNYVVQVVAVNKYGSSHASKSKTFTIVLPTPGPPTTQRSTTANPDPEKNESEKPKTIVIAISVLIGLLLILAVVFFALWMKRRTGRENPPAYPVEHVPGPLNGDVYAMVETAKKTSKKSKNESDLVYAELSDLSPTGDEEKPPTYVPTDYADIAQILTPDGDLTYSNVQPRCAQEGAYANVKDMGTK